jgi:heme oxygenase
LPEIADYRGAESENAGPLPVRTILSCNARGSSQLEIPAPRLSARLRARTDFLHEQTGVLLGLPDAIQTLEHYRGWLCQFLGLYESLEHSLARFREWGNHGFALPSPSLSDCLAADLATLGIDPAGVARAPPALLPHLPTFAHALGALYVLEGSSLGGRVILREVEVRIGPRITGATRFFGGRGTTPGQAWQAFKIALDAFGHEWPNLGGDVVSGAEGVFHAIIDWFAPLHMMTGKRT